MAFHIRGFGRTNAFAVVVVCRWERREGCALFTFFRTEGVAHELNAGKKGGGDVSGAGEGQGRVRGRAGTVALSLWCRCVVAYVVSRLCSMSPM